MSCVLSSSIYILLCKPNEISVGSWELVFTQVKNDNFKSFRLSMNMSGGLMQEQEKSNGTDIFIFKYQFSFQLEINVAKILLK